MTQPSLPGSDHQDVRSLSSGLGDPHPHTHTHTHARTCGERARFPSHIHWSKGNTPFSSCFTLTSICTQKNLQQIHTWSSWGHSVKLFDSSSAPPQLSWSSPRLGCPGPAAPGRAAGYCSRSYRRGWAQTTAGLALGSSGHSSWRRTRSRSSCSRTQTGHHTASSHHSHTINPLRESCSSTMSIVIGTQQPGVSRYLKLARKCYHSMQREHMHISSNQGRINEVKRIKSQLYLCVINIQLSTSTLKCYINAS